MGRVSDSIRRLLDGTTGSDQHGPDADAGAYPVSRTDAEWRESLTAEEYRVLRTAATERAWTGALLDEKRAGVYACKACGSRPVPQHGQVRVGLGLAELLRAAPRGRQAEARPDLRHGPHRGALRRLRIPPRAPVRRCTADPYRRPILHELGLPRVRGEVADRSEIGRTHVPSTSHRPLPRPRRGSRSVAPTRR